VLVAPAMNTNMFEHDAVRQNLATLTARGVHVVDPGEGYLACGWIGKGRLADPEAVAAAADAVLRPAGTLLGRSVLVSAGPTYEDLDPVRFLGNRSSGRMGYAVATEAIRRGARVILVSGPTRLDPPAGAEIVNVRRAAEMHAAIVGRAAECDAVVMAAAVADYTPEAGPAPDKLSRNGEGLTLRLVPTPDILGELGRRRGGADLPVLVGFAAESGDPVRRARVKLKGKQIDLVVANDVTQEGAGFDVETNAAVLVGAEGEERLPLQPKTQMAQAILDRVERLLAARHAPARP
jgi:phosphopantothenoylcysteine decarboxylase/phosphopantothenate--cysteine ligase